MKNLKMFAWSTSDMETNDIIDFMIKEDVKEIYMQSSYSKNNIFKTFIANCTAVGIKVYAMNGADNWINIGNTSLSTLTNWYNSYQASATTNEKFTGIILDVEPYTNPFWTSNNVEAIKQYQDLVVLAVSQIANLSLCVPFWFDTITYNNVTYGQGVLSKWILDRTNMHIMSYRDRANGIINLSENEVNYASVTGKKVTICAETVSIDVAGGANITFGDNTKCYMYKQLEAVDCYFKNHNGYGGIAIHHYRTFKGLEKGTSTKILKGPTYTKARLAGILHETYVEATGKIPPAQNVTVYGQGKVIETEFGFALELDEYDEVYQYLPQIHKNRLKVKSDDLYLSFEELSENETLYGINSANKSSNVSVIAIHGGGIEVGSDELAFRLSELGNYNYYAFLGNKPTGQNSTLHITSANFDEPIALNIVTNSDIVISIHGFNSTDKFTYLGGLDIALGNLIKQSLEASGFTVSTGAYPGIENTNICNRGKLNKGVQLELSTALRSEMLSNATVLNRYAQAIKDVIM